MDSDTREGASPDARHSEADAQGADSGAQDRDADAQARDAGEFDFDPDSLFSDLPEVNRLGFYAEHPVDLSPDFARVVRQLAELERAAEDYTDEYGYEWRVTASRVDEARRRVAWVEWRSKDGGRVSYDDYYLKARDESGALLSWEIQTYNPHFGCRVRHLGWSGDAVVIVYEDKHDTYAAALRRGREVTRARLGGDWRIDGDVLTHRDPATDTPTSLSLPSLERL